MTAERESDRRAPCRSLADCRCCCSPRLRRRFQFRAAGPFPSPRVSFRDAGGGTKWALCFAFPPGRNGDRRNPIRKEPTQGDGMLSAVRFPVWAGRSARASPAGTGTGRRRRSVPRCCCFRPTPPRCDELSMRQRGAAVAARSRE